MALKKPFMDKDGFTREYHKLVCTISDHAKHEVQQFYLAYKSAADRAAGRGGQRFMVKGPLPRGWAPAEYDFGKSTPRLHGAEDILVDDWKNQPQEPDLIDIPGTVEDAP